MKNFSHITVLVALILTFVAGCSSTGKSSKEALSSAQNPASQAGYVIGSGDNLAIFVWRNPELSITVPVRPDGNISVPLVEDMMAAGKTPTALARDIEEQFKRYIRDPVVTVIVKEFVGSYDRQVRVVGAAAKPQSLPYKSGMSLLDVMIAVGGLSDFAEGNKAKIARKSGDHYIELNVKLEDLIQGGDIKHNIAMQPGDVLIIPESWF